MEEQNSGTPPQGSPKHEFNTQDIIANLRVADKVLVDVADFFFSVPFLSHPVLWKAIIVLFILLAPLMAVIALVSTIGAIFSILTGNIAGLIAVVISLGYVIWLATTTLFNPKSDLKLADLNGWSKVWMIAVLIQLIVSSIGNIWIRSFPVVITTLIWDFIAITITLYISPFALRYFHGVVLDGLKHHPKSKYHPNNKKSVPVAEEAPPVDTE
ncbi:MAG: hypothetical protein FWD03_01845 [Defluviitaleaceae bacterium]|nr:hypothetical protein [Defluviitaleaceae bacterium]